MVELFLVQLFYLIDHYQVLVFETANIGLALNRNNFQLRLGPQPRSPAPAIL